MDFSDTPEEAAYREKARKWLAENAPKPAPDNISAEESMKRAKAWQAKKQDAGYAQITWPKEWGGAGGTSMQSVIYSQEEYKHNIDAGGYFAIGLGMCVPTVMAFADDATKKRFVGPAARGEEIWCQLFSEPGGGSDVAAIRTRAVKDGNDWVVNGQKVWTSGAHYADYGLLLARTNMDKPKHKGLTMFWLDMKSKGVDVRPIHQMSGASNFNEVYFADVRIPDSQRLGEIDDGWNVSIVTLMNERLSIGGGGGGASDTAQIMRMARSLQGPTGPAIKDAGFREKLADWYIQSEGLKHGRMRTLTALSRGQTPGPESSIGKVVMANQMQSLYQEAVESMDQFGIITEADTAVMGGDFQASELGAPGMRIAGGTDEILRNIIAERVLGLPGDIRVDKSMPFKDHPKGK
jgi:alkylation response protein AidB-like acyl-CoA dehydrogenase